MYPNNRLSHLFVRIVLVSMLVIVGSVPSRLDASPLSQAAQPGDSVLMGPDPATDSMPIPESYNVFSSGSLTGIWEGMIRMDPAVGTSTFSALLSIVDGAIGQTVGLTAHPSIRCGGVMRLQNATPETLVVASDYIFGPCLDGTHILTRMSDGRMSYEWHDPRSTRIDRGTLTKTGGVGSALPTGLVGIWQGTVNGLTTQIALVGGNIGTLVGTAQHPSQRCGAKLMLQSVTGNSIVAGANYFYGNCVTGGYDVLTLRDDGRLDYEWHHPNGTSVNRGVLTRISGPPTQACELPGFGDSSGNALRQDNGPWAAYAYGGTDYVINGQTIFLPFRYYGGGRDSIAAWGCYLTSAAMIVNYFSVQQGKAFRTDPGALNQWLQHNQGYYTGTPLPNKEDPQYVDTSFVNPQKVAEYANLNGVQVAFVGEASQNIKGNETVQQFMGRTRDTVDSSMCALNPIIMRVSGPHFVDATATAEVNGVNTWRIHDPLASPPTTLLAAYDNAYTKIVRFTADSPGRVLSIAIHSNTNAVTGHQPSDSPALMNPDGQPPVEVVLIDPQGRRTGFDPRTGTSYAEIPGASYGDEYLAASGGGQGLMQQTILNVIAPLLGQYRLQVIGTGSGMYSMDIMAVDNNGRGRIEQVDSTANPGTIESYQLNYTSVVGQPISVTQIKSIYLPLLQR